MGLRPCRGAFGERRPTFARNKSTLNLLASRNAFLLFHVLFGLT
jgi:hypothetical protein